MSRLIDVDELLQEFEIETNIHRNNDGGFWHWTGIKAMIEKQPTVYNVEEVVRELQKSAFSDFEEEYVDNGEAILFLADAIEIVRKGGVKNE